MYSERLTKDILRESYPKVWGDFGTEALRSHQTR